METAQRFHAPSYARSLGFVWVADEHAITTCELAIDLFRMGRSSATALRSALLAHGVAASEIARVLNGENVSFQTGELQTAAD